MSITFKTRSGIKIEGIVIPGAPDHAVTCSATTTMAGTDNHLGR